MNAEDDDLFEKTTYAIVIAVALILMWLSVSHHYESTLIKACMSDGNQEYECYGIVHGR